MKISAFTSVWPKHMEPEAEDEMKSAKSYLEEEYTEAVIRDNKDLKKDKILTFKNG